MGKIGKGKAFVGTTIPQEWRDEIDRRARPLRLSRSAYTAIIIEQWWSKGCPPVNDPDKFMQIAKGKNQGK